MSFRIPFVVEGYSDAKKIVVDLIHADCIDSSEIDIKHFPFQWYIWPTDENRKSHIHANFDYPNRFISATMFVCAWDDERKQEPFFLVSDIKTQR